MKKIKYILLSIIIMAATSFAAVMIYDFAVRANPYRSKAEIESAKKHVDQAELKSYEAVNRRAGEIKSFIDSKKPGAEGFSKDIISLRGKWRVIKSKLPFTDKEGHKKFIQEKFSKHIFSDDEFNSVVSRAVNECLKDLDSIENELAVALRVEILGTSFVPELIQYLIVEYDKIYQRLMDSSQNDAYKSAGSLVVSELAAQITRLIFIQTGILGASTANSWWTFGAALVVGLMVDALWEWIDDPAGDIEKEVLTSLDNLSNQVDQSFKENMQKEISRRKELWAKKI